MFTHIVMFKLKDRSPENVLKTKDVLTGMQGKIPAVISMEVGVDMLRQERSFDLVLTSKHHTFADYEAYQSHPVHQEVLVYMRSVLERSVSVDYEYS